MYANDANKIADSLPFVAFASIRVLVLHSMPLSKEKKKEVLGKLQKVTGSKAIAFVNFHGLTVANATELRRKLKEVGVGYVVAKKSLTRKALADAGIAGTMPELAGELGIAYLSAEALDMTAPTRETFVFQKKFENKISLLGGVFEGKFIGKDEARVLAEIPSRQTLYAQFVNLINSPIQSFVMALDGIAKKKV